MAFLGPRLEALYGGKCNKCKNLVEILAEMGHQGPVKNAITYNSAISAGGKCNGYVGLLELMAEMRGLAPNVITYSSAITACGNCIKYEKFDGTFG